MTRPTGPVAASARSANVRGTRDQLHRRAATRRRGPARRDAPRGRPAVARAASGTAASAPHAMPSSTRWSDSTYGSDRTMRRIHRAARPSSASPTIRHTRPTPVPTSAVGRARVDQAREREVAERRGADDHRREARLCGQRPRFRRCVEPAPQRRRQPVDRVGRTPSHRGGDRERAGRGAHARHVVLHGPSFEGIAQTEPEPRPHVHPPQVVGDRAVGRGEAVDRAAHGAAAPELGRDLLERARQRHGEPPLPAGVPDPQRDRPRDQRGEPGEHRHPRDHRGGERGDRERGGEPQPDRSLGIGADVGVVQPAHQRHPETGREPPTAGGR